MVATVAGVLMSIACPDLLPARSHHAYEAHHPTGFGAIPEHGSEDPRVLRCAPPLCAPAFGSSRVAAFGRVRVDHQCREFVSPAGSGRRPMEANPTRGAIAVLEPLGSWRIDVRLTPAGVDGNNTDRNGET